MYAYVGPVFRLDIQDISVVMHPLMFMLMLMKTGLKGCYLNGYSVKTV